MKMLDVVWFSNVPAPYRFPLWREVAQQTDLLVCFLARTEPGRRWDLPSDVGFDWTYVGARRLSRGETHLYVTAPGVRRAISAADVVVIGGWESPANWRIIRQARRTGASIVLFYESTLDSHRFSSGPFAAARRRILRAVDVVLTVGPASRDAVIAEGVQAERVVMGSNSVDDAIVRKARELRVARRVQEDLVPEAVRYLFVGRLIPLKNVDGLIRAFATVRQPADRLTIVGEGTEEATLHRLVDELQLGDVVDFAGYLVGDALASAYADSDCLVLPSTTEVWGMVVQEALDAGLAAVVTEHAGIVPSLDDAAPVVVSAVDVASLAMALHSARGRVPREPVGVDVPPAVNGFLVDAAMAAIARAAYEPRRRAS